MALRLIEITLPEADQAAEALLQGESIIRVWQHRFSEASIHVRVLCPAESVEAFLDSLEKRYASTEGFRAILLTVDAVIPRPVAPPGKAPLPTKAPASKQEARPNRVSREELYAAITESSRLSPIYMGMGVLSTILAASGLMRNSIAVEIGAMVLAPLLGPHMALSLATTLADIQLARRALKAATVGILTAFALAVAIALILRIHPDSTEIVSRTKVGLGDVGLALVSGIAGALAFTSGVSATLIGVMVAVALMPPLVACGLLLGAGRFDLALGALTLLLTNLICVNLAGVTTFLVQGVRPLSWWEANRAKKATRFAILWWAGLLAALIAVIMYSHGR